MRRLPRPGAGPEDNLDHARPERQATGQAATGSRLAKQTLYGLSTYSPYTGIGS